MLKTFSIDFIRQALEQKLLQEHLNNVNYFGGKDQVSILSFYEQLKSQDQVDRFVETYRDLTEQQNRTGLILNGVLVSPENPTITNLYSSLIVPMTFTCSFRCTLKNRDQGIATINNLIENLKGRKVDIAQLNCVDDSGKEYCEPFMVGTIGQGNGAPKLKNGDFIGEIDELGTLNVENILTDLASKGVYDINDMFTEGEWYYVEYQGKIIVYYCDGENYTHIEDDGTYQDIIFPPEHNSFEKYKVSFSFDAIRCDEPRNLNGSEYCELSFGGSATLVSNNVKLGNDLLKVSFHKNKIVADTNIDLSESDIYYLEPLEMPSGSNANTQISQLMSNKFVANSHTDSLSLTLQYTFIASEDILLLKQWFKYARYGTQDTTSEDLNNRISPNIIYDTIEYWCSWGNYDPIPSLTKIVGDISIENTESDTLTIGVSMQIQGENN